MLLGHLLTNTDVSSFCSGEEKSNAVDSLKAEMDELLGRWTFLPEDLLMRVSYVAYEVEHPPKKGGGRTYICVFFDGF